MEFEGFAPVALVVRPPLIGGPVAARVEETMEDGEEDGPRDIALEAASLPEWLDDPLAPGLWPEPLATEGGSAASGAEGGSSPWA